MPVYIFQRFIQYEKYERLITKIKAFVDLSLILNTVHIFYMAIYRK